ncbi:MAG: exo-alpha-sialidase [Lentisphaerae bacterium]|nr:exo-alpha-sialidase [Lentisphaerota bacterium]MBT4817425.1 exo-alpha-sialidase [Lentisphaerota bacterium]MBT7062010.1 exo-alpha-sialidase [Lentisphaerota bacterium]
MANAVTLHRNCSRLAGLLLVTALPPAIHADPGTIRGENSPVIDVSKAVYVKHPAPGAAAEVKSYYTKSRLVEIHTTKSGGHAPKNPEERESTDDGRTWSMLQPSQETEFLPTGCNPRWGNNERVLYDPVAGLHVSVWWSITTLKTAPGKHRYYNHAWYRLSEDDARTWARPRQLRYEPGPVYDFETPYDASFLEKNLTTVHAGCTMLHSNGTIVVATVGVKIPEGEGDPDPGGKYGSYDKPAHCRDLGIACFVGRWDKQKRLYDWKRGNCVWLPRSVVRRGFMEAAIAELRDGRILVVCRGTGTAETPGRKWYAVSSDGGMTLSKVRELKYDDGTRFYSPSSYHRVLRSSATGKLYWVGNICPEPPQGNAPRYPLVIAEIDEDVPALKRNTATVIDDCLPPDSKDLQLSNFSLIENRRTRCFELFLTRIGERALMKGPNKDVFPCKEFWTADCYKYTLTLK